MWPGPTSARHTGGCSALRDCRGRGGQGRRRDDAAETPSSANCRELLYGAYVSPGGQGDAGSWPLCDLARWIKKHGLPKGRWINADEAFKGSESCITPYPGSLGSDHRACRPVTLASSPSHPHRQQGACTRSQARRTSTTSNPDYACPLSSALAAITGSGARRAPCGLALSARPSLINCRFHQYTRCAPPRLGHGEVSRRYAILNYPTPLAGSTK